MTRYRWLTMLVVVTLMSGNFWYTPLAAHSIQTDPDPASLITTANPIDAAAPTPAASPGLPNTGAGSWLIAFNVHQASPRIARAYEDRTVDVVDMNTGETMLTIPAPELGFESNDRMLLNINDAAFSPDGAKLVLSFGGSLGMGFVRVIDVSTGDLMWEFENGAYSAAVAWSSDALKLAAIASDHYGSPTQMNRFTVWNVQTGADIMTQQLDQLVATSLAWSPASANTLAILDGSQVQLYDVEAQTRVGLLTAAEPFPLLAIAWSPDGARIAATGETAVIVWDYASLERLATWPTDESAPINLPDIAWSPDGAHVATSSGAVLKIWRVRDQRRVFTGDTESTIHDIVWADAATIYVDGVAVEVTIIYPDIDQVRWNHSGTLMAVVMDNDLIRVLDGQSQQPVWEYPVDDFHPHVSWNPRHDTQIAIVGYEFGAEVWDVQTQQRVFTLDTAGWLQDVAYSPDGSLIATAHGLGTPDFTAKVQIWNAANGQLVAETRSRSRYISSLTWSPNGDRIAGIAGDFNQAVVWNAATGEEIAVFPPYDEDDVDSVWSVRWSPQGNRIVTDNGGVSYSLWDSETYELQAMLTFSGGGNDMEFDMTGDLLALAGDFGIQVVDIATGTVITEQSMPSRVRSISWRPNSNTLSVGGAIPLAEIEVNRPTPTPPGSVP